MKPFRNLTRLLCLLVLSLCLSAPRLVAATRPPNVVIIFTDDQGSIDLHCYGATDLVTPNMDALARRGVRFTQFYAAAPVCSPSRAGLLTGRFPLRAGLAGNAPSEHGKPGLPTSAILIPEMMKAAGYATAHVGKWHLGYTPETMPNGQGFDFSFGHMGGCIDNYSHFFYWAGPNRHDLWLNGREVHRDGQYFPDLMVQEASEWIRRHQDRPFFLYFAINMPHYPYQGKVKWLEHYAHLPYPRNLYAAFISSLDERIGQLVDTIDSLGLRENTIIVFQSDQGHSTEERAHFGGGNAGPYRGAKFSLFEGGIRIPAVISWPGHLPENETRTQVAHGCDWMPTIAELCGVKLLDRDIDGRSLVDVIRSADAPSPHEVLHWTIGKSWAVREGDWKLLGHPVDTSHKAPVAEADDPFLVNLAEDVTEMKNLAHDHPDRVRDLQALHDQWMATLRR